MNDRSGKLRQLFARYVEQLSSVGIEQAEVEAEWILCHVLKVERLTLYLEGDALLTDQAVARADAIVRQRQTRHPLQFILNESWFYGRKFYVTEAVMAPTPETELLVESALRFLAGREYIRPRILDVGVGSGVISVTLAKELTASKIVALDISSAAIVVGRKNAADHDVADQIEFRQSDFFSAVRADERFDLIISNPPYIAEPDYAGLDPEVKADPKIAMTAGPDGLDAIRAIVQDAPRFLAPGGRIMFEIGHDQAEKVALLTASDERYKTMVLMKDLNDLDRIAILSLE